MTDPRIGGRITARVMTAYLVTIYLVTVYPVTVYPVIAYPVTVSYEIHETHEGSVEAGPVIVASGHRRTTAPLSGRG